MSGLPRSGARVALTFTWPREGLEAVHWRGEYRFGIEPNLDLHLVHELHRQACRTADAEE